MLGCPTGKKQKKKLEKVTRVKFDPLLRRITSNSIAFNKTITFDIAHAFLSKAVFFLGGKSLLQPLHRVSSYQLVVSILSVLI